MTPEDVNRAYEAASNLDFLIRTLQFTAATNEPITQSCFDAGLDAITAAFDEFNELIAPILPHFQSSAPARYGFDMHPSMHVAILNCADHLRRKPTRPDSYNDATDGFIHSVATLELPRRDEMEAALWNEKQSTTVVVSLQSQVSPQSRSVTKNGPSEKGGTHDRSDSISTNRGDPGSQGTDKSGKVSTPKIPPRRFWNNASPQQKLILQKLLNSPDYCIKRRVLEEDRQIFRKEQPSNETIIKALYRLNWQLGKTANGWKINRSPYFERHNAEICLIHPE